MAPHQNRTTSGRRLIRALRAIWRASPAGHVAWLYCHPFNHGRRINAVASWCHWQVASRIFSAASFPWVDGLRLAARPGLHGVTANVGLGLAEPECMGFLLHYLRPGDLFIDVGANAGSYTTLAASRGARVIAAEPNDQPRSFLAASLRLNGLSAVTVAAAVSSAPGEIAMDLSGDATGHVELGGRHRVAATTLDALAGGAAAVIKVDVEGHEGAVIAGGERALRLAPAAVIETWGSPALHRRLADLGLKPVDYSPATRRLTPRTCFAGAQSVVFVRDMEAAARRVATAKPFALGARAY